MKKIAIFLSVIFISISLYLFIQKEDYYIPKPLAKLKIDLLSSDQNSFSDDMVLFKHSKPSSVIVNKDTYKIDYLTFDATINFNLKNFKDLNTEILSACPSNCRVQPNVEKGKRLWCKKNLGISKGINISTRKDKVNFANKKHILIDDYIKNINEWKRAGGIGIHHRTARATLVELKNILLG